MSPRVFMFATVLAVLLTQAGVLRAQVPLGQTNGEVQFEASGGDGAGAPIVYSGCRVALTPVATTTLPEVGAPTTVLLKSIVAPAVKGPNTVSLAGLFTGQPNGQYKVWVQLVDTAGIPSTYALAGTVQLFNGKPAPPTGVKIRVVATIDLPVGPPSPTP